MKTDLKQIVAAIKTQCDIVAVAQSSGIKLKKTGTNTYKGLCPFHTEKSASFAVYSDCQSFHCFGCGKSGDIIDLMSHTNSTDFMSTVRFLAESKGIDISGLQSDGPSQDTKRIYEVIAQAHEFYRSNFVALDDNHPAKKQITARHLSKDNHLFGYSPEAPHKLYDYLVNQGYTNQEIELSGLVIFKEDRPPFDFFHARLMITINDYLGRPISFNSRKLFDTDKMPGKYVNGRDSILFHKQDILFNIDAAKKHIQSTSTAIILEGPFDVFAAQASGYSNVVASSGTAFTLQQINLVRRLVGETGKIILSFDSDAAGINAAKRVFQKFNIAHNQLYVSLSEKKDICDMHAAGETEKIKHIFDNSVSIFSFLIDILKSDYNFAKSADRQEFVREAVRSIVAYISDKVAREMVIRRISVLSATDVSIVRSYAVEAKPSTSTELELPQAAPAKKSAIEIEFDPTSDADRCYITALSMLARRPDLLLDTPAEFPDKYSTFISELKQAFANCSTGFKFINEGYTASKFAKALMSIKLLDSPDDRTLKQFYSHTISSAKMAEAAEKRNSYRASALSSLNEDITDTEIISIIEMSNL